MGARYTFTTTWRVHAPAQLAWDVIAKPLEWPSWWKGVVAVEELEAGEPNGMGALHRYAWKSALPYKLIFEMRVTGVDEPDRLTGRASGELEGDGAWTFMPDGEVTVVRYSWDIETTRPWMNAFAPLLRPAFEWNHDWVMNSGATGLETLLGVEVESVDEPRRRRRWPIFAAVGALGAGLFLAARRHGKRH
ncbi:MAG: SRPBCC family protein [bacterium]